jgi:CrcB protein
MLMERMLFTEFLIVGAGGFLGSGLRFVTTVYVQRLFPDSPFPYGTATVNIIGCLLIGYLGAIVMTREVIDPALRLFVLVGILGGFTTFSAFAFENLLFVQDSRIFLVLLNVVVQVVAGFIAAWAGFQLARFI